MLKFDLLFFLLNLFPLVSNLLVHALPLLLLVSLVFLHVFLEVTFQLFDVFNLKFLLLQLCFSLFKLLVFVSKTINLCFKFIWLLLFDHSDVSRGNLFKFSETTVTQSIAGKVQFN
jgi:hypothetical protein